MPKRSSFLTSAEVARMFGIGAKTVGKWAQQGKLPFILTLGGHRRYPRAEIERIVEQLTNARKG